MPITNPASYSDKTADYMAFFGAARVRELAPLVTPALIDEHRRDPRGIKVRHSETLQQVLNFIHNAPTDGKSFAYAEVPGRKYRLGIMRARGTAPTMIEGSDYATEDDAVHAVFLDRLARFGLLDAEGRCNEG